MITTPKEWFEMTPDDQNDAIMSQVDREFPMLKNLNDDEDNLLAQRERRWVELVNNPELWNF